MDKQTVEYTENSEETYLQCNYCGNMTDNQLAMWNEPEIYSAFICTCRNLSVLDRRSLIFTDQNEHTRRYTGKLALIHGMCPIGLSQYKVLIDDRKERNRVMRDFYENDFPEEMIRSYLRKIDGEDTGSYRKIPWLAVGAYNTHTTPQITSAFFQGNMLLELEDEEGTDVIEVIEPLWLHEDDN